jgi:hypothetical protein
MGDEKNLELTSRAVRIGLNAKIDHFVPLAADILSSMGRLEYLLPLFRCLKANGYTTEMHQIYSKNKTFYSPIARNTLRPIVGNESLYEGDHMSEHWANHKFFMNRV